jgi:hypothetical protein
LSIGNKIVHERFKLEGYHLGNDFCNVVDQANGPIVGDLLAPSFLDKSTMLVDLSHWR